MFYYLRLFSIISLILVAGVTFAGGWFLQFVATDYIVEQNTKNSISISNSYLESVWKETGWVVPKIRSKSQEELKSDENVLRFAKDSLAFFKKMPITRFNVYDNSGLLIISGSGGEANIEFANGQTVSPDPSFVSSHLHDSWQIKKVLDDVALAG